MNLKEFIIEVDSVRRVVEVLKIEVKVNDGDINEWNDVIIVRIEEVDSYIEYFEEWLGNRKMEVEK